MKSFLFLPLAFFDISPAYVQVPPSAVFDQSIIYPALSGWHGGMGTSLNTISRWPGIQATTNTYNTAIDGYIHKIRSGISLNMSHVQGPSYSYIPTFENYLNLNLAPKFKIGRNIYFSPCVSFNYYTTNFLSFSGDPWHNLLNDGAYNFYGFGAGAAVFYQNFMGTVQSNFLNRPYPYLKGKYRPPYSLPMPGQFAAYAAQRIDLNEKNSLTPSASYARYDQFNRIAVNLNFQRNWLYISSGWVLGNSLLMALGGEVKNTVRISYTYELTVSKPSSTTFGSHYFSVRALLFRKKGERFFAQEMPLL